MISSRLEKWYASNNKAPILRGLIRYVPGICDYPDESSMRDSLLH